MSTNPSNEEMGSRVYTIEEVLALIKEDRERIINYVEGEMAYGIRDMVEKVEIRMQL